MADPTPSKTEGVTKFDCVWTREPLPAALAPAAAGLVACRQELFAAGLVGADPVTGIGFGNVSLRIGDGGAFLITGSQTGHLPELTAADLSLVDATDLATNRVQCRGLKPASSESLSHAALYRCWPQVHAVIHVHNHALWERLRNRLPTTPEDVPYGTPAMAEAIARAAAAPAGVLVMGGHQDGLLAYGPSLAEAARELFGHGR